jgi:hypothetical protein
MSGRRSSAATADRHPPVSTRVSTSRPGGDLPTLLREAIGHSRLTEEDIHSAANAAELASKHLQTERDAVEHSPPLMHCVRVAAARRAPSFYSAADGFCRRVYAYRTALALADSLGCRE